MYKRMLSLVLTVILVCTMFSACTGGNTANTPSDSTSENASADTPVPSTSGSNVIKVGFAGPLSGASGQVGASCYNGALMAFNEMKDELEQASGCTLEFVTKDRKSVV